MDFNPSPEVESLLERIEAFMVEHVYPNELEVRRALDDEVKPGVAYPKILVEIRAKAKDEGLWNLFLPDDRFGAGPHQLGVRDPLRADGPQPRRRADGLQLLRAGHRQHGDPGRARDRRSSTSASSSRCSRATTRSCFSMTEPEVSGSDPTTLQTRAELDGDEWVINGHKWFTSGAVGADFAIAMVVTDPDAAPYNRASMILVPIDNPGLQPGPRRSR